jgi:hypothetical protein
MASGSFYARGGCWSFYTAKTHMRHGLVSRVRLGNLLFQIVGECSSESFMDLAIVFHH